jgi:hypothetical protein
MKRIVENYISKTMGEGFIEDLKLALGERLNLFDLISRKTAFHPDSELNHRKTELLKKVKTRFYQSNPLNASSVATSSGTRFGTLTPNQARVLFINGIVTTRPIAQHQASMLSQALQEPVELIYNETEGLIKDLLECNEGRHGILNEEARKAQQVIMDKLATDGPLTIVAYSQGAIIATSALNALAGTLSDEALLRISFVTFGAGFRECQLPSSIHCEHFANRRDPVTKLGLQHANYSHCGQLFMREAKGHLFVADYLTPMRQGYSYGESQFQRRIKQTAVVEYRVNHPVTTSQFIDLLKRSTLGERRPIEDRACIRGMLQQADLTVSAWLGGVLVGIARSVTDFHFACYLSDLAVDEACQNQGIGLELQRLTKQQLGPRCTLMLLAAPKAHGYYEKIGYEPHDRCWISTPSHHIELMPPKGHSKSA